LARNSDTVNQAGEQLRAVGRKVIANPADMVIEEDGGVLGNAHFEHYEDLDVLVPCAWVGSASELGVYSIHRFDKQFAVK
jgi:hypothetical protein